MIISWMKPSELSKKYGIAHKNVDKAMERHGYKKNKDGKYREDQFLKARAAGVEMDKNRKISASGIDPDSEDDGQPLSVQIMKRKIQKMDWEIRGLKAEYEKMTGELIPRETYRKALADVVNVSLSVIDLWIGNISAKRADAGLLDDLRKCRDAALAKIHEHIGEAIEASEGKEGAR
jgi:hypothetical protein